MARDKPNTIQDWIADRIEALAKADRTRFFRDVFAEPSIGPVAAWLIGGLVTLVAWLTQQYAPGAVERAAEGIQGDEGGIIPISMGYWTLAAVGAITFIAAIQPIMTRQFTTKFTGPLIDWFSGLHVALRVPVELVGMILNAIYHVPACVFSGADYLLARPVALIAGTGFGRWWLRYGIFLVWMAASLGSAWLLPAPFGLYAFVFGSTLIIGVVRRWNWVEADRAAFFVRRQQRPEKERVGFAEDLRDEALLALLFLFLLIPLGLRQADLAWPETFSIRGTDGDDASVLAWLVFFGAEMAKSVPFVDWSEVFHVANGSPIEPGTVTGAQIVFTMRATLDLIMIAAVVQAVQLSTRLAEQRQAFEDHETDVLEPFVERTTLRTLGQLLDHTAKGTVLRHRALREFPPYSLVRLVQIADPFDTSIATQSKADPKARMAALALLTWQRPDEAQPIIGRVLAAGDLDDTWFAEDLQLEIETQKSVLVRAYKDARAGVSEADIEAFLSDFSQVDRQIALRAVRSAIGELEQMIAVPGGEFLMGALETEEGSTDTERPQHLVRVDAFEIGKCPVTFEEFDAFCEATGYYWRATGRQLPDDMGWGRTTRPVVNVTREDAWAYINWLNGWTEGGYRLPSEAEWEYACRSGSSMRWSFGNDEAKLSDFAWFKNNSDGMTHPVGELRSNAFGLHDMHGNVYEWCEDAAHETYFGAPDDGSVWIGGDQSRGVRRGGGFRGNAQSLRCAARIVFIPTFRDPDVGFRLARSV